MKGCWGFTHLLLPFLTLFSTWHNRLIEWCFTLLSTVFQSYHGNSSHYSCLPGFHQNLAGALKCLAQWHSHKKTQGIWCRLNPGLLNYESNTLPQPRRTPPGITDICRIVCKYSNMDRHTFCHLVTIKKSSAPGAMVSTQKDGSPQFYLGSYLHNLVSYQ